jgi:hypothetical protein
MIARHALARALNASPDGGDDMSKDGIKLDITKKLPANRFGQVTTKKGHVFKGWFEQEGDDVMVSIADDLTVSEPEWAACVYIDIQNVSEAVLLACPRCHASAEEPCKPRCGY